MKKQFSSSSAALNCFPSSYKVSHLYRLPSANHFFFDKSHLNHPSCSSSSWCQSPIPHSTLAYAIQALLSIPMLQPPFDSPSRYSLPQFHQARALWSNKRRSSDLTVPTVQGPVTVREWAFAQFSQSAGLRRSTRPNCLLCKLWFMPFMSDYCVVFELVWPSQLLMFVSGSSSLTGYVLHSLVVS